MANHGFITSKRFWKKEKVYHDLCEINKNRFNNLLSIKDHGNGFWSINYDDGRGYPVGFDLWISSTRKLEHRHPHNTWAGYLEIVFVHELAGRYGAILSDESSKDRWQPNPKKYSSYKKYIDIWCGHVKNKNIESYTKLVELYISFCPKELIDY